MKVHRAEKRERAASKALDADLYPDLKLDPDRMMPEQTVIVWDLETVPDLAAAARMLDMGEAEVRAALGESFPKHRPSQDRLHRGLGGEPPTGRVESGRSRRSSYWRAIR